MIDVTRLNGKVLTINSDLIEFIEETPDTVITFTTGTKIVVKESCDEIKDKIIEYKSKIKNLTLSERFNKS
jgi:flagellar protein FlbD